MSLLKKKVLRQGVRRDHKEERIIKTFLTERYSKLHLQDICSHAIFHFRIIRTLSLLKDKWYTERCYMFFIFQFPEFRRFGNEHTSMLSRKPHKKWGKCLGHLLYRLLTFASWHNIISSKCRLLLTKISA